MPQQGAERQSKTQAKGKRYKSYSIAFCEGKKYIETTPRTRCDGIRNRDVRKMNYLRMGRNVTEATRNIIKWTPQERDTVAAESFRIHTADPTLSLISAVALAQEVVLPASRHRPVKNGAARIAEWLTPIWESMREDAAKVERSAARAGAETLFIQVKNETTEADERASAVDISPATSDMQGASFDIKVTIPQVEPSNIEPASNRRQVHWKDDERRTVVARAYSNLKRWPDMSRLEAFRKAQDSELPDERRRVLPTYGVISDWADPMLEALALDEQIEAARIAEERERERAEALEQAKREARAEVERERAEEEGKARFDAAVAERMANLSFDDLIGALCRKLGREVFAGFAEGFSKLTPPTSPPPGSRYVPPAPASSTAAPLEPSPPPRPRLPKVCVVGLLNQQENDVERAFLGVLEFVFVKAQRTGGNGHGGMALEDKTRKCDLLATMVDFMGHDVERHARKLDIPLIRVNGSVSALKRELRTWLDQQPALMAA